MIAIVSKDAGGAEILSSWVKNNPGNYKYYLSGPAKKIFKSKIGKLKISNLRECIFQSDTILSSTGTTRFEINALQKFRKQKKKTIVYLDHWVNYKERFLINDRLVKVDEIWVNDKYAYKEVKKIFKDIKIKQKRNYFLEEFISSIKKYKEKKTSILYLTGGRKKNTNGKINIEILLFKYFLEEIYFKKFYKKNIHLIIRVHPNENFAKYKKNYKKDNLIKTSNNSLASDISKSFSVYGHNTMALYLARKAGIKKTFNFVINNDYKHHEIMANFKIKKYNVKI